MSDVGSSRSTLRNGGNSSRVASESPAMAKTDGSGSTSREPSFAHSLTPMVRSNKKKRKSELEQLHTPSYGGNLFTGPDSWKRETKKKKPDESQERHESGDEKSNEAPISEKPKQNRGPLGNTEETFRRKDEEEAQENDEMGEEEIPVEESVKKGRKDRLSLPPPLPSSFIATTGRRSKSGVGRVNKNQLMDEDEEQWIGGMKEREVNSELAEYEAVAGLDDQPSSSDAAAAADRSRRIQSGSAKEDDLSMTTKPPAKRMNTKRSNRSTVDEEEMEEDETETKKSTAGQHRNRRTTSEVRMADLREGEKGDEGEVNTEEDEGVVVVRDGRAGQEAVFEEVTDEGELLFLAEAIVEHWYGRRTDEFHYYSGMDFGQSLSWLQFVERTALNCSDRDRGTRLFLDVDRLSTSNAQFVKVRQTNSGPNLQNRQSSHDPAPQYQGSSGISSMGREREERHERDEQIVDMARLRVSSPRPQRSASPDYWKMANEHQRGTKEWLRKMILSIINSYRTVQESAKAEKIITVNHLSRLLNAYDMGRMNHQGVDHNEPINAVGYRSDISWLDFLREMRDEGLLRIHELRSTRRRQFAIFAPQDWTRCSLVHTTPYLD